MLIEMFICGAFNVFESAAQYNAVKGNGNFNARQWIDRSVENKIAVEDRMGLTIGEHTNLINLKKLVLI